MVDGMAETVLQLDGRLESSSVPTFQNQLLQATLLGNERLVLDLSRVSFVGSAAVLEHFQACWNHRVFRNGVDM